MSKEPEVLNLEFDRRGFFKLSAAAGLAVIVPSVLAACGGSGTPAASGSGAAESGAAATTPVVEFPLGKTQIQALGGGLCGSPTYVAKEKGIWAEEGIDVELVSGTFQQQKDGLASGQFLVTNGDFQFFPAVNEGLDIKIIGGFHEGCIKLLVPSNSTITSVAELKGKRIGVDEIGGTPWAITSVALANSGIDPREEAGEVTWVPYDLTVLHDVAESGEIDAFAAWDPFGTQAEKAGAKLLVDIGQGDLFGGKYCCFLYASADAVDNQPEQVAALLRGWYRAVEFIAANPEETVEIITDGSQHEAYVASDDNDLLVELLKSYHYHAKHDASNAKNAYNDALYFVTELQKTGYLPESIDPKQFTDRLVVDIPWQA